jgi:thioredoxin-like negative regulator of GroEL
MSEHIHHVTDDSFEPEVLQSATPVLVDYWAEWCGPCKMIAPILAEIRHPRHSDADDLQERLGRSDQGRRTVEIAVDRVY